MSRLNIGLRKRLDVSNELYKLFPGVGNKFSLALPGKWLELPTYNNVIVHIGRYMRIINNSLYTTDDYEMSELEQKAFKQINKLWEDKDDIYQFKGVKVKDNLKEDFYNLIVELNKINNILKSNNSGAFELCMELLTTIEYNRGLLTNVKYGKRWNGRKQC